jgi:hypothetical protein
MLWLGLAFAVALLLALASIAALLLRYRAYRRRLSYDPRQSWTLGLTGPAIETLSVDCREQAFILPKQHEAVSGFLEVEVDASVGGLVADPAIEIHADQFRDVQCVERGARGSRFFNISRLLKSAPDGARVCLSGRGLRLRGQGLCLHFCRETISSADRILVIAPHPDDAEIAAFGLYSDTDATVVTLTAGDASDRYRNSAQSWMSLSHADIARMRVLDSLAIPQLGGVPPERAMNLCFHDGRLREMYLHPEVDFWEEKEGIDFLALRRMNRSPLMQSQHCAGSWLFLIHDLSRIISAIEPTIVVAPHPKLDPHVDHVLATVAVGEALEKVGSGVPRMFLYAVHNRRSELWPFGPAGGGVAMLPLLADDGLCGSSFYSHALSVERQRLKLVALEAMHDLRDLQWPVAPDATCRMAATRIAAELRAAVHGMGLDPTSYLRRAVRPDELFFVTSWQDALAMARQAIERQQLQRAA